MVFNDLFFLFVFLPLALILFYVFPKKLRIVPMILTGLIFFSWGEPSYLVFPVFSVLFCWLTGLELELLKKQSRSCRGATAAATVVMLLILGYFKYTGFLLGNINALTGLQLRAAELALPIGISFYTFSALSYVFDVAHDKVPAQHDPARLAAYLLFFPKLSSGPIVKYAAMVPQLEAPGADLSLFGTGLRRFLVGLFKKVLLADSLGSLFSALSGQETLSAGCAWLGVLLYGLQLYYDFCGYSDMAIGLSGMFGFAFGKNFDYPYCSCSVGEFWNRWHISLASWFKEYLYIPLGGSRCSTAKTLRNILIVWLCTGIWHGADWSFVLWGLYQCAFILLEKTLLRSFWDRVPKALRRLACGAVIMFAWPLFFSSSAAAAMEWYGRMFGSAGAGFFDGTFLYYLKSGFWLIVIGLIGLGPITDRIHTNLCYRKSGAAIPVSVLLYGVLTILSVACVVGSTYSSFLYFQF